MRIVPLLLGLLLSGSALAEPDTFWLGSGRSGSLLVNTPNTLVNHYARLTASAAAGTRELTVSPSTDFVAGELVLLHQSTGLTPAPPSGAQGRLNLETSTVGQFEYARVEAVSPGALRLTAPLINSYPPGVTQVVSVPEYTDVQVLTGASLQALPWNGSTGGILAMLVSGTLSNDGLISADSVGFRGGPYINQANLNDCPPDPDLSLPQGGSIKGEGLVPERFGTASGRGNLTLGGGGGSCHNSGGGGGGHAGLGGRGAFSVDPAQNVGGLGGAAVDYLPHERLLFGGGGGAGHGNNDRGTSGGTGGGLILIRAGAVTGTGRFSARGMAVPPTTGTGDDGAGGGGAGGAISLRALGEVTCGGAEASGGSGGNTIHPTIAVGPGGGGSGGVIFLQGASLACPTVVLAGAPGRSLATGTSRGAGPISLDGGTSYGSAQPLSAPLRMPATPTLTQPADGAPLVEQRTRLEGVAEPDVRVHLYLDGQPYAELVPDGSSGTFAYTPPSDLPLGARELSVSAEFLGLRSPLSPPSRFEVVMRPVLVLPAEDARVDPTPLLAGTSLSGATVSLEIDDVEVARLPLDAERRFLYTLPATQALAPGRHSATVRFWDAAGNPGLASPPTSFEVLSPSELDVGCGCGASPGTGLGAMAVLLGLWVLRRRHGPPFPRRRQ
ncbi:adventurous gliding motility protein AgmC [Hyalangium gracile]|uniref:adventurous gliding motility protein AgmC n=1 Tax=Hyalangium gracile TaxID=394092 RepID=UPI001CCBFF3A|nr:MYXO-CTERM sorting domain-containing protein [Hyalangium gracile]